MSIMSFPEYRLLTQIKSERFYAFRVLHKPADVLSAPLEMEDAGAQRLAVLLVFLVPGELYLSWIQ